MVGRSMTSLMKSNACALLRIPPLVDSTGRIGHVIASGDHVGEAIRRADTARQLIAFEMERASPVASC